MTRDEAFQLLGVSPEVDAAGLRSAYDRRRGEIEQRLATAPTDALRTKYQQGLGELVAAYELLSAKPAGGASLSATKIGDLPQASPSYTQDDSGLGRSPGQSTLTTGTVLADRYEVRRLLGMGGMGAVYEANDRLKHENVALKVLLPHLLTSDTARRSP